MSALFRVATLLLLICGVEHTHSLLFKSRTSSVKIGSFNLRRYSLNKASPSNAVNTNLAKILKRYELVFLQEVIDPSSDNRVVNHLLGHLHKQSRSVKYEAIVSPPLGATSYKERLVYLHRTKSTRIQILSSYVYNGSVKGAFERPPFVLHVKVSSFGELVFLGVHLKPDNVYNEFRALRTVVDELKDGVGVVLLGDFNADCSYLNNAKKKEMRQSYFHEFHWLIDDRTETNLLQSCSYDRIIVSAGMGRWKKVNWKANTNGTFHFDKTFRLSKAEALKISDHLPVEVEIH